MKFSPHPYGVEDLIKMADDGRLGLPEFQRSFVWKPADVADFLRTVARDWPGGSFLLLEGPQEFTCKPIEKAPPLHDEPRQLILDGQQRMTALYQALKGEATEVYYVNMGPLLAGEPFDDDHLSYMKKEKFFRAYPNTQDLAQNKVITVGALYRDAQFFAWVQHLADDNDRTTAVAIREQELSGFRGYDIPCVVLPRDTPIEALAKIFETINKTGVRLNAFDLMVAKLYPHEFRLRDEWSRARDEHPVLQAFDVEGIEILKLIALREHLHQRELGPGRTSVRGVRESDVLRVNAIKVKETWEAGIRAYVRAMGFLRENCGVCHKQLLPSSTMLLPLADALWTETTSREGYETDLVRWFWCSTFSQTYAQGANTRAVADARALRAWRHDQAAAAAVVVDFAFDEDALFDLRRRNEIITRALAALLVKKGARDWITDVPLSQAGAIEFHHTFAKKWMKDRHPDRNPDVVANFTPLVAATNKQLKNYPPNEVVEMAQVKGSALASHGVDADAFSSADFDAYLTKRAAFLKGLVSEATSR